jgi:O-antigen ligase
MIGKWLSRQDLFLYAYLVMVLGCIYFLFNYLEGLSFTERAGESLAFQLFWLLLYIMLAFHIAWDAGRLGLLLSRSPVFLIFATLAVISLVYEGSQAKALIKFAMYLATIMFSAWLAISCSVDRFVETLFRIGAVVLAFHIVLFPLVGSAIDYDALHRATILGTEAYAGVFGHKNLAGTFFGLMVAISFVRMFTGPRPQIGWSALFMALHLLALAATGAAGPLVGVTITLAVTMGFLIVTLGRWDVAAIYWLVLGFVGLLLLLFVPMDDLYSLVGRSEGLTGRSFLWSVWPHFFWQRPWLGFGFSGFFSGLPYAPSTELTQMAPWNTEFGSFENSYLDALLQFGLLGGAAYILMVARGLWNTVVFGFARNGTHWLAPFAMMTFIVFTSTNDSSQLLHNYIGCVLVFWCYFGPEANLQPTARGALALSRGA